MTLDVGALRNVVTVADGGISTQLQLRGLPGALMAETANVSHPQLVQDLARAYLDAGARFLTTNTFAANCFALERRKAAHSVADVNQRGAELIRAAIEGWRPTGKAASAAERRGAAIPPTLVAGSIGPSGKILAVREATEEQLAPAFAEQAKALAAGGADVIVLETFSELREIVLALQAVKQATGLPVIASMSFDSGPQRTRTMMGAKAEECGAALDEAGADIIGCNCGGGISTILPAVVALRAATKKPLWVKPNAGLPELEDGKPVWRQTPEEFAAFLPQILDAGANIVGGCCGSGPEHIRKISGLVARRS